MTKADDDRDVGYYPTFGRESLMSEYRAWLARDRNLSFKDYEAVRQWSVTALDVFWHSIWDYSGIQSPTPFRSALVEERIPGAIWFSGAQVNYTRHVFRHVDAAHRAGQPAILAENELGETETIDWQSLQRRTVMLALRLRALGVGQGDRIAAVFSNRPEAIVAFLACASLGAVWSVCAPDMGLTAMTERFGQIEPKILIAVDGAIYAGHAIDYTSTIKNLRRSLPSVENVLVMHTPHAREELLESLPLEATVNDETMIASFEPVWVPFDHPLWVVYSSGTTGKPKAIVHGHGGILTAAAVTALHLDLGACYAPATLGERFHWYSTTGWIVWNIQVNGLLGGTTLCLFDGSPSGPKAAPDWGRLWRFAARHGVTFLGAGAQFYATCMEADLDLAAIAGLQRLRTLGSTASPLPATVETWISERLAQSGHAGIWWCNSSGGTDICTSFVSGVRDLPPSPGRMQCRALGAPVEAWDDEARPLIGEVGELVCTRPMPSMPLFLWGDHDGARYRAAYFDHFPGVWRHGDWLKISADGTCEISGRSDATINRGGHRMGTSEIYTVLETLDEVTDALIFDVDAAPGDSRLLLFLQPKTPGELTPALAERAKVAIREQLSPRFVPDDIIAVEGVPRTLSNKRQELPIKRLFQGMPVEKAIDPTGMANPDCLSTYVSLAKDFRRRWSSKN